MARSLIRTIGDISDPINLFWISDTRGNALTLSIRLSVCVLKANKYLNFNGILMQLTKSQRPGSHWYTVGLPNNRPFFITICQVWQQNVLFRTFSIYMYNYNVLARDGNQAFKQQRSPEPYNYNYNIYKICIIGAIVQNYGFCMKTRFNFL